MYSKVDLLSHVQNVTQKTESGHQLGSCKYAQNEKLPIFFQV